MRQYQKKINLQLEKERFLAKQLLADGKKEWVQYYSQVLYLVQIYLLQLGMCNNQVSFKSDLKNH